PTTLANLLGLANGRTYNTKNRAAFTGQVAGRDGIWLWDGGFSRADLINTGVPVSLAKVPISAAAWMAPTNEPFEAQYLKVYDVTPPPSPAPLANYYQLGTTMTFTWDPASAGGSPVHDVIASYLVTVRDDSGTIVSSATVSDGSNSYSFTGVAGETYRAEITAVSAAGISSTSPASSNSGAPNGSIPTTASILLDPNADEDGDGDSNGIEVANGRDPLVPDALFRIISIGEEAGGIRIVFTSIPGSAYAIETSTDLGGVSQSWTEVVDDVPASSFVTSFLFTGPLTEGSKRFYRVGRLE
ncbi:fibronectin type III domain-containing protein, partial [Akkermansiaceae bacterium]|nr:fibronectin type III domain-containing protein [Akkermansiaceae bacterium]